MRRLIVASSLALLGALLAPAASADWLFYTWDDRTSLTFSGPVALPGVTLPAGTYLFRFPSRVTARTVIQVVSQDQKTLYGMFMTRQAWRTTVSHQQEVVFAESAAGAPAEIKIWYPAHQRVGYEFLYSRDVPQAGTTAPAADPPAE